MNEAPMTAADVAAVVGNRGWGNGDMGGFGGGWWGIIGLLVIAGLFSGNGFGGFGGNGRNGDVMTTAEACNMNSFGELKNQVGRMNDMMFQDQTTLSGAICTLGYQGLQHKDELSAQIAALGCNLEKEIANQGAMTRDLIQANKIECLQEKVAALEADARLANVVRYPNQFVYSTNNPFFNCNTCCGNGVSF